MIWIFIILGNLFGMLLGLMPGMSINNLLPLILSFSFSPIDLSVLIVSLAVSLTFASYIPSIFLGAPDPDTSLAVLPAHRLLFKGRGYEALFISVVSSVISLIITLMIISLLSNYFVALYKLTRPFVAYLLIFVIFFLIFSEWNLKTIVASFFIFFLSGFFGLLVLNTPLVSQKNVLFPTLSGFFGLSTMIISLKEKSHLPKQKIDKKIKLKQTEFFKSIFIGSMLGIIAGFLPGIGVSQMAITGQYLLGTSTPRSFLASLGAINIANEVFSLNSLYLVNNPRSGASVAIQRLLPYFSFQHLILLTGTICLSTAIAAILTLWLGKTIYKFLIRINYTHLNLASIAFLTLLVALFTGFWGLVVFITSASIGLLAVQLHVKRSMCMGVLLLPSILFFLGLTPQVLFVLKL